MDAERHARISKIFLEACELEPSQHDDYLERMCGADRDLRAEIEELLAQDGKATRIDSTRQLEAGIGAAARDLAEQEPEPTAPFTAPGHIPGYRIVREIGAGGAGSVFEAHDLGMDRRVALKILAARLALSQRSLKRFRQEAWIAGKLSHPNIVRVFDRGSTDAHSFYAMELVEGGSLHDVAENMRRWGRDDRLGLQFGTRAFLEWTIQQVVLAARALHFAHERGVVHRDIKPMNLLLGGQPPSVKIADFGLAIDEQASRLTTEGRVIGTLRYMAPEQLRGHTDQIDGRTDIYALGVTLFELLTLEFPYRGDTYEGYLTAALTDEARRPGRINERVGRDLEIVIRKCLEKDRRDRYATAGALADDLENVLLLRPIRARPSGTADRLVKWTRRKPIHALLAVALVIGVPLIGSLGYRAWQQQQALDRVEVKDLRHKMDLADALDRYDEVVPLASQILKLDPRDAMAFRSRAMARHNLARQSPSPSEREVLVDQALQDLDRLRGLLPDVAWPVRLRAVVLRAAKRSAMADEAEREAATLTREPPSVDDLHFDGLAALDRGEFRQAAELLTRATRSGTRHDTLWNRSRAYGALGEFDRALADLRVVNGMNPADYTIYVAMAQIYTQLGDHDQSEGLLDEAARLAPDDHLVYECRTDNLLGRGRVLGGQRKVEEALASFQSAERAAREGLRLEPEAPFLHVNLGASLMEQYRISASPDDRLWQEAADAYETGRRLGEQAGNREIVKAALANLCDALIQIGQFPQAEEACTDSTLAFPEDPIAFYNLAAVYALTGRTEKALDALTRDVELGDNGHEYLLGDAWFESLREHPGFRSLIQRMRESDPG